MRMSHFVVRDAIVPTLAPPPGTRPSGSWSESLHAAGQFLNTDLEDIVRAILRGSSSGPPASAAASPSRTRGTRPSPSWSARSALSKAEGRSRSTASTASRWTSSSC